MSLSRGPTRQLGTEVGGRTGPCQGEGSGAPAQRMQESMGSPHREGGAGAPQGSPLPDSQEGHSRFAFLFPLLWAGGRQEG